MQGKTVVITGGTSGIGEVAAKELARMGARMIVIARDKSRADATLARLRRCGPGLAHCAHLADLTRIAEMKRVAAEIAAEEPRIDVLINNAGALFGSRQITADGLEYSFALNHLAYFVVTELLRDRLVVSAPARIVSTASGAHEGAVLVFDDLQSEKTMGRRKRMAARSSVTSCSHGNWRGALRIRESLRIACIQALSPRGLEIRAAA